MQKSICLAIILLTLSYFLFSCSRINQSVIAYNDPDYPPLKPSFQNTFSHAIPPDSVPPEQLEQSDKHNSNELPAPPQEYITYTLKGRHDEVLLAESEDAGQKYVDETTFIGDSTTLGLKAFKIIPLERVFAAGSIDPYAAAHNKIIQLPDEKTVTIPQAVGYYKPKRVVITLGTNSVSWIAENAFYTSYGQLIEDIKAESPQTEIIIQTIPPVTEVYEAGAIKLTNKTINRFNELLLDLAFEKSVYFLNTASVLKNERGFFDERYHSGDGLHHNQASYDVWLKYLRTHAVPQNEQE
ncbi:MAG: hypothetical protein IJO74_01015 [Clostridia bacterium]|nr:hypothetical protein [Clostridia bacterium]